MEKNVDLEMLRRLYSVGALENFHVGECAKRQEFRTERQPRLTGSETLNMLSALLILNTLWTVTLTTIDTSTEN